MKIIHVETGRHFYGGAQQVIWLVNGLRAAGIDCELVCTPDAEICAVAESDGNGITPSALVTATVEDVVDVTAGKAIIKLLYWEADQIHYD